ncbi:hypothetical protein BH11CYA1_BH11CYA1_05000 [soil metagenome]
MAKKKDDRVGKEDPEFERESELARRELLQQAWVARNALYLELFGEPTSVSPANYGPPVFTEEPVAKKKKSRLESSDTSRPPDSELEGDQQLAVLAYGPDPFKPYWTYVTAGISSPWVQTEAQEVSGFGCELMIKSPTNSPWAPQLLRTMAFYIFNHAGTLSPGKRINLGAPIAPNSDSLLRSAIIWYADEAPDAWYQLPSGGFGLFLALGVTEAECAFADSTENYGTWCIEQLLRRKGYGQITNPERGDMMSEKDTPALLESIKQFADTFRQFDVEADVAAGQED